MLFSVCNMLLFMLLLLYAVVSVEPKAQLYLNKYLIVFNKACPILSDGQPDLLNSPNLPKKQNNQNLNKIRE